jgi:hypothetical protein
MVGDMAWPQILENQFRRKTEQLYITSTYVRLISFKDTRFTFYVRESGARDPVAKYM